MFSWYLLCLKIWGKGSFSVVTIKENVGIVQAFVAFVLSIRIKTGKIVGFVLYMVENVLS